MAIDYLSYTKRGFLPAPNDDDNSFLTRSGITMDYSEQIRFMAANRDRRLESMLSGTAEMFNLNNFHDLACKDINDKLGMYPAHFVGFHTGITKVMRKDSPYKKRTKLLGVCESMNFNGFEVPFYVVDENISCPLEVSVHELYHCMFRIHDIRMPFSPIRTKIGMMVEEFRGDLLMTGEDILVDKNIELIKKDSDRARQIISESKIKIPHSLDQLLNRPLVRKSVYMKYQHNYVTRTYSNANLTLKTLAALGSLAIGMVNPMLLASPLAQLLLTVYGLSAGGFTLSSALHGIYSNYKVTKANEDLINFMAHTRESLNSEFGIKGANFIAYTLYHPEIREMTQHNSAKDYLHKKGTTRSKALLVHALSL